jgi:hypothetical protein
VSDINKKHHYDNCFAGAVRVLDNTIPDFSAALPSQSQTARQLTEPS